MSGKLIFYFKTGKIDLDLDHMNLKINSEHLLYGHPLCQVWEVSSKGCTKTKFDLDLCPCYLKINRLSSPPFTVLATFHQRGQEILSSHHLYIDQQFDLDLCPCENLL